MPKDFNSIKSDNLNRLCLGVDCSWLYVPGTSCPFLIHKFKLFFVLFSGKFFKNSFVYSTPQPYFSEVGGCGGDLLCICWIFFACPLYPSLSLDSLGRILLLIYFYFLHYFSLSILVALLDFVRGFEEIGKQCHCY